MRCTLYRISDKYDIFPEFLYAYHGRSSEEIDINGQKHGEESLEYEALKFKASVNVTDTGSVSTSSSQYNDALYSSDLMETFVKSLELILNKMMKDPAVLLSDISMVSDVDTGEGFQMKPVPEHW
jgi:hypothetical protein